ncbi:MAG: c-type cytochrome [Nevskiales bacterium]
MKTFTRQVARIGSGLLLASCATIAVAAGDVAAGRVKASTCMGCHGIPNYVNTYPTYHVPYLGGQHTEYLVTALKAYQTGERSHPTMKAQAGSMSEQDMQDIAAFLSQAPHAK